MRQAGLAGLCPLGAGAGPALSKLQPSQSGAGVLSAVREQPAGTAESGGSRAPSLGTGGLVLRAGTLAATVVWGVPQQTR